MSNLPMIAIRFSRGKIIEIKSEIPIWYAMIDEDNKDFHIFALESVENLSSILFGDVEFSNSS